MLTRRHALRLVLGAGVAAVPALRLAGEASAARAWCRSDPTVRVAGAVVHLWVAGLLDQRYDVAGPTKVVFRVPAGVDYELLDQDAGFGQGYDIEFEEDDHLDVKGNRLEIAADVYVPATTAGKNQPILVEWVPDGTVKRADSRQGKTNSWLTVSTKIKRRK